MRYCPGIFVKKLKKVTQTLIQRSRDLNFSFDFVIHPDSFSFLLLSDCY
jgi:hypothetical protein